jgi:hypothetical protein
MNRFFGASKKEEVSLNDAINKVKALIAIFY